MDSFFAKIEQIPKLTLFGQRTVLETLTKEF